MNKGRLTIGVLALQGSFAEHLAALEKLGVKTAEVREPADLPGLSGLILPGGESTVLSRLMQRNGLFSALKKAIQKGLPAWGTCAGAILLSRAVTGKNPPETLGVMNIRADRNAYGAHLDSFEAPVVIGAGKDARTIAGVFIRAPQLSAMKPSAETLATLKGRPVLFKEGRKLAGSFHPELTDDLRLHRYFVELCAGL